MKKDSLSYETIQSMLLEKMQKRSYSAVSVTLCRYVSNSIFRMMKDLGYQEYCKEGASKVLKEYLNRNGANQYYSNLKTIIHRMDDLLDGIWRERHGPGRRQFSLTRDQAAAVEDYCSFYESAGRKPGTITIKKYVTSWFLYELSELGCSNIDSMTLDLVVKACIKITDHNLWGEIRSFLKYLSDKGTLPADYSTAVPHYQKPYVIPSVYSEEEVLQIENSIDRVSATGKRDYAMLLLASRMGLRSGDIVNLRIQDIDFNSGTLDFIQQKTNTRLHLPLLEDVRKAIQDYIASRPVSIESKIFLTVCAPYGPISTGSIRYAMRKYILKAGISTAGRKMGPHSLRSSMASSMVNDSVSYETVRKILGHSSDNAIKHYARIDIERLRPYCLIPPAPTGSFREFLGMRKEG